MTVDESNMLPEAINASKSASGKWMGLPSNIYTYVLYCNKKKFADAGVKIPANYAEFLARCQAVHHRRPVRLCGRLGAVVPVPEVVCSGTT